MCGLAGVFGINNFTKIKGAVINNQQTFQPNTTHYLKRNLSILLHIAQLRGTDSSGVFLSNGKDLHTVVKETCTSSTLISTTRYEKALSDNSWDIAIGHARAATVGGTSYEAAHPHVYGNIMLVHNGTVRNHSSKLKGSPAGVSDSAAIAWSLNEVDPDEATSVFAKLSDFGAVIWYDTRDMSLNIAKDNSRTLFWTKPPKKGKHKFQCGYISSQREALHFVLNNDCPRIEEVPSFVQHKYKNGEMVATQKWEEFKEPVSNLTWGNNHYSHYPNYRGRISDANYASMIADYAARELDDNTVETKVPLLEKGCKIRLGTVLDLGASRPLKATYRDALSDTVYQVFIDQPPLSLFEEYETLMDKGGVVEIRYVHGDNIYARVCAQSKSHKGTANASK